METRVPLAGSGRQSDRRRAADRRVGDRRLRARVRHDDRRDGRDRRRAPDRREGPTGHIRNALQILQAIQLDLLPREEQPTAIAAVVQRLWLALGETERLDAGRRALGQQLMLWRPGGDRSESSASE